MVKRHYWICIATRPKSAVALFFQISNDTPISKRAAEAIFKSKRPGLVNPELFPGKLPRFTQL